MAKYTCQTKNCPAKGQTFEWDNVDAGTVCRTCELPMDTDTGTKAPKAKVAEDE